MKYYLEKFQLRSCQAFEKKKVKITEQGFQESRVSVVRAKIVFIARDEQYFRDMCRT